MEEAALDLALSMDVFSAVPLVAHPPRRKDSLNDDELEHATQALSINDDRFQDVPPVVFNFLRPRYAITNVSGQGVEGDKNGSRIVDLPLGVRQLLADWKLGEDPNQFVFRNPDEEHEPAFWKRGKKVTGEKSEMRGLLEGGRVEDRTRSQIPVIMASVQVPPPTSTQRAVNREERMPPPGVTSRTDGGNSGFGSTQAVALSQPLEILGRGPFGASSQTWLGPSTQVLAGSHGGRPEAHVAKKKQKKRAKGF